MAFYKLFCLIHRRTDWPKLYRWQRRIMMPEWYEEKERQAMLHIRRLALMDCGIRAALGESNYYLEYGGRL